MPGEAFRYLKWGNDTVGIVHADLSVQFTEPNYNTVMHLYTQGRLSWTSEEFLQFLSERIPSASRRDIEKILFRCGLSQYDVFKVADVTHAINPRDELWLASSAGDRLSDATTEVFEEVFHQRVDMIGDSVDTPEGANVKRYAACNGAYGIVKQRFSPLATDVESEIAVYLLAQRMGVACCPAVRFDADSVFSEFCYDFTRESIVHMRRLFDGPRGENELQNLLGVRPQYAEDFYRMLALDFVTRQDDRHLSNMAVKVTPEGESFYPLYDNGRSLFFEDTEEFVQQASRNPNQYVTTFGYAGTYWDHVQDIVASGVKLGELVNLEIEDSEIADILVQAGFKGYRLEGAHVWITHCLAALRDIG